MEFQHHLSQQISQVWNSSQKSLSVQRRTKKKVILGTEVTHWTTSHSERHSQTWDQGKKPSLQFCCSKHHLHFLSQGLILQNLQQSDDLVGLVSRHFQKHEFGTKEFWVGQMVKKETDPFPANCLQMTSRDKSIQQNLHLKRWWRNFRGGFGAKKKVLTLQKISYFFFLCSSGNFLCVLAHSEDNANRWCRTVPGLIRSFPVPGRLSSFPSEKKKIVYKMKLFQGYGVFSSFFLLSPEAPHISFPLFSLLSAQFISIFAIAGVVRRYI